MVCILFKRCGQAREERGAVRRCKEGSLVVDASIVNPFDPSRGSTNISFGVLLTQRAGRYCFLGHLPKAPDII